MDTKSHVESSGRRKVLGLTRSEPELCFQTFLSDSATAEEAKNARAYPDATIVKLRPGNNFNSASYKGVFTQNFPTMTSCPRTLAWLLRKISRLKIEEIYDIEFTCNSCVGQGTES